MAALPKKLKHDSIVEAVLELRFEHQSVGEVIVGKLASGTSWQTYQVVRLPIADLPSSIRDQDPELRHQSVIQLQRPTPGELVKIGPRVASLHVLAPYPGWVEFRERLSSLIDELFSAVPNPYIERIGLRYVNAITPGHGISEISQLNFNVEIGGVRPPGDISIVTRSAPRPSVQAQLTLASPTFAMPGVPGAVAFVDIDMSTPHKLGQVTKEDLAAWLEEAHDAEKEIYFSLLPSNVIENLKEQ